MPSIEEAQKKLEYHERYTSIVCFTKYHCEHMTREEYLTMAVAVLADSLNIAANDIIELQRKKAGI